MGERANVVVVGGGIGGVVAGLALVRTGREVVVLERAGEPAEVGSGITLMPNGLRALDAIGAGDAVRAAGAPPPGGSGGLRTPAGKVLVDASKLPVVTDLLGFHRADLHRALRGLLPEGVLRLGAEVAEVHADGAKGTVVELTDGSTVPAGLTVAADGARSRTRAALHPGHPGLRYAGYTSWRAVTPVPVDLHGVAGETWGRGERFGILPLRDGRVYWFAVANQPAGGSLPYGTDLPEPLRHKAFEEVLSRFGGWHQPIPALLAATPPESVLQLDIHDLHPPLPPSGRGCTALLGDAAHAMTPDVGQGASQAIEDAVTLAAMLAEQSTAGAAVVAYDRLRRPRAGKVLALARRTGRMAQLDGRFSTTLRDALVSHAPPALSLRMVERVTAWQPPAVPAGPRGG